MDMFWFGSLSKEKPPCGSSRFKFKVGVGEFVYATHHQTPFEVKCGKG